MARSCATKDVNNKYNVCKSNMPAGMKCPPPSKTISPITWSGTISTRLHVSNIILCGSFPTCPVMDEMVLDGGDHFILAGIFGLHTLSLLLASLVAHDRTTEDNHTHAGKERHNIIIDTWVQ